MATGYVYDQIYLDHDLRGHPENAGRLRAIWTHLQESHLLPALTPITAQPIDRALLHQVHVASYCERVEAVAEGGGGFLDSDTYVTRKSYDAALMAAGGTVEAVSAVLDGNVSNAFALVRPPGHHALPRRGMGFCLFNNIALGARYALDQRGISRVLIVDFDVHHGNGTQDAFYDTNQVLFFSTHQYPFYPGTGNWKEIGAGEGEGYTINVPLPYGVGDNGFATIFERLLIPMARRYQPELILSSAGFDAHWSDPLAALTLSIRGYAAICHQLHHLAKELCAGRLIFVLEGGYNLDVLSHSVSNAFRVLLGHDMESIVDPHGPSPQGERSVDEIVDKLVSFHGLA